MTYNSESSTRLDDPDRDGHPDHDPRDPVYSGDVADADDVRDEAYHAGDTPSSEADAETQAERDNDTEFDGAARRDATDAVDDETGRDGDALYATDAVDDQTGRDGNALYATDNRQDQFDAAVREGEAEHDAGRDGDFSAARADVADDREGDAEYDATRAGETDAVRADETDVTRDGETDVDDEASRFEGDRFEGRSRVDGEAIAVPDGPVEANPPTAVAVAPVNAAVPSQTDRDDVDAREAQTDRDAVEAVNADAASGTVYQAERDEREEGDEYDEHRADNGPIMADQDRADLDQEDQGRPEELKPGAVEPMPMAAFWNQADAQGIRERWQELQLRFIDDPQSVAGEAERLVEEAVAGLTASLNKAKQDLGGWRDGEGTDTEKLRAAVRSYRDFLDRVLGL